MKFSSKAQSLFAANPFSHPLCLSLPPFICILHFCGFIPLVINIPLAEVRLLNSLKCMQIAKKIPLFCLSDNAPVPFALCVSLNPSVIHVFRSHTIFLYVVCFSFFHHFFLFLFLPDVLKFPLWNRTSIERDRAIFRYILRKISSYLNNVGECREYCRCCCCCCCRRCCRCTRGCKTHCIKICIGKIAFCCSPLSLSPHIGDIIGNFYSAFMPSSLT